MIHTIRKSKFTKVIASYLALQLVVQMAQPLQLVALTSGPKQPEFNSFTPIGTSDMVNLSSGDFNYNIPIMDVGGYPLNLAYDAGVTMDQEASWTGLGWNLNVGQINRQVRGIPDDFKGDEMIYENNFRPNTTVGVYVGVDPQIFGIETPDGVNISIGANIDYNNFTGLSFKPSYGLSFGLSDQVSVGLNVATSATEGVTVSPSVSASTKLANTKNGVLNGTLSAGVSYNSSKGLSDFSLTASITHQTQNTHRRSDNQGNGKIVTTNGSRNIASSSGRVSFINPTLTPRKRTAFINTTGTFAFSIGGDVWGLDAEAEISAMGSVQKIKDPMKVEKAYGYDFTGFAPDDGVLDYNREKDQLISKTTLALPTAAYTYDLYSVQGQGVSGMFRPFRSQVGEIHDPTVEDESASLSLGVEIEPGTGMHAGVNFVTAPSVSRTGKWDTNALRFFKQEQEDVQEAGTTIQYEPVYHKYIGEPRVDQDQELFENLGGYSPIALKIGGSKKSFDKYADARFRVKRYQPNGTPLHTDLTTANFSEKFRRTQRDVRNQSIQKISAEELPKLYTDRAYINQRLFAEAEPHHTAEVRVQQADGSYYIYGETAYNTLKKEVTFTTDSQNFNCAEGTIRYNSGENSLSNRSGIDHFYNAVTTPKYAHTYLLSSVLSSDYEDLTGDGPTDDDLGAYTNFIYTKRENGYKWRVPYGANMASYNAGMNTNKADQKGSYIYGEKELKYLDKIITKTHVAVFELSPRKDGRGVRGEDGGGVSSGQQMYKIDRIQLYSKPEAIAARILDDNPNNDLPISAIKTAHFEYDYSQCKNVENNLGGALTSNEISNEGGKLTLKKVYFTYRNSQMGRYTPYVFHYDGFNPDYNLKSYDIWGNYKPNMNTGCATQDSITAPEFPFVQQQDRALQDERVSAWSLTSIDLPSGGRIDLTYESDDYQYVQDRPAMQMFTVAGAGVNNQSINPEGNQKLYKIPGEARYLYVKLPDETTVISPQAFQAKYLKGLKDQPIYFRFLLNMSKSAALNDESSNYDYVTGYFNTQGNVNVFAVNNAVYAAIPMAFTNMEGGVNGNDQVNPISKAGWYFGRRYLPGIIFGINQDYRSESFETIAKKVVSSIGAITDLFTGPNGKLRSNKFLCAQRFIPEKSWIRLATPKLYKLGGGSRIKRLAMKDQWHTMVEGNIPDTDARYAKEYGQEYDYTLTDGSSSGVATYEPNQSKENPFVEPFYNDGERLIAPREVNYVEKPFGEQFFPSAQVTYSRVTVKNLTRENISTHATGKVVTEYYTSKEYPTKVDYTDIDSPDNFATDQNQFLQNAIKGLFGATVATKNEYTLSQGFVVHTNDMNGKMKKQSVFAEAADEPISTVTYRYNTAENDVRVLDNKVPVIYKNGQIEDREVGVDYDVVTDFRESYSKAETKGVSGNIVVLFIGPLAVPVPMVVPSSTRMENVAHSVITTKVIHTTAVMKEQIATDLGSKVSTINEAWDAETGQVLLTRTVNEYDDEYYNFNFPAYWAYVGMGQATKNLGITGTLARSGDFFTMSGANEVFTLGDEIVATYGRSNTNQRLWVVGFNTAGNGVLLMDREGSIVNRSEGVNINGSITFKIVRSGHRNQQGANMASITMMKNPIQAANGNRLGRIDASAFTLPENTSTADNLRVVNASAVVYEDFWNCQCESELPFAPEALDGSRLTSISQSDYPFDNPFNPYQYNAKGEWRAKRSYAYLTERDQVATGTTSKVNTRREGYFKTFVPYYTRSGNEASWQKNAVADNNWTFASEVTQYSPFGAELENKDALDRYSSAQYSYNYTLPTAVGSNSRYRDMGMDGFEDYNFMRSDSAHFNYKRSVDKDGFEGVRISDEMAHTGRKSILIPPNDKAELERNLIGEIPANADYDNDTILNEADMCPYTPSSNADYDGDGIGDECDDDAIPQVFGRYTTNEVLYLKNENGRLDKECIGKSAEFTIYGNPNETIEYAIIFHQTNYRGMALRINNELLYRDGDVRELQGTRLLRDDIVLDARGQKYINLDFDVVRAKSKRRNNTWEMEFMILNKIDGTAVNGTSIKLRSEGTRVKDCGEPEWGNLDDIKR